jgi:hypothetical protein
LKKFGKSVEKSKFENLVTLLQLIPLIGFLTKAEKIGSTRGNFIKCVFVKINFTRGMLDLASQKLRL